MPLFRSKHQPVLLAELYLHEDADRSFAELASATQIPYSTVNRELNRLADSGLLVTHERGRLKLVRPNTDSPYHSTLRALVEQTFGPLPVLKEELTGFAGIEFAFIYGSWAARYNESPGPLPRDIDVLVVGSPDLKQLRSIFRRVEERLRLEVNFMVRSLDEWTTDDSGFKQHVQVQPVVTLTGELS